MKKVTEAAFTQCMLARASQVPGSAQTFHTCRIMEVATRFEVQPVKVSTKLRLHEETLLARFKFRGCARIRFMQVEQ